MLRMRESDKHFLWSMFGATGIILFWKGVWEGVGGLPFLENPWASLFIGAVMLTFSGIIFKEFDPLGGVEKGALKILQTVQNHPKKHEYTFKYYDKAKKQDREIEAKNIKSIEKNILAFHEKGREFFVPVHRVKSVHKGKEIIWRM